MDAAQEASGSGKEKVDYFIREVVSYELYRAYSIDHGNGTGSGGCESFGTYQTRAAAEAAKDVFSALK